MVSHNPMVFTVTYAFRCTIWYSMILHGILWLPTALSCYRLPWYFTFFNGTPWSSVLPHDPVVFHDTPWCSIVPHGPTHYLAFFHGTPRPSEVLHGLPWYPMVFYLYPSCFTHSLPYHPLIFHSIPRSSIVSHDLIICHGISPISLHLMVFYGSPWYFMAPHGLLSNSTVSHDIPWYPKFFMALQDLQ